MHMWMSKVNFQGLTLPLHSGSPGWNSGPKARITWQAPLPGKPSHCLSFLLCSFRESSIKLLRMALNLGVTCFCLLSSVMAGLCYRAWLNLDYLDRWRVSLPICTPAGFLKMKDGQFATVLLGQQSSLMGVSVVSREGLGIPPCRNGGGGAFLTTSTGVRSRSAHHPFPIVPSSVQELEYVTTV